MIIRSRRKLLKFLSVIPFLSIFAIPGRRARTAPYISEDFILIHGWLLKKSDLSEANLDDY